MTSSIATEMDLRLGESYLAEHVPGSGIAIR